MKHLPILRIGSYGLHITKNPAGTFSFVGSIPVELFTNIETGKTPIFKTELEGIEYVKTKLPNCVLDLNEYGLHKTEY
jgi:hypothetical protein